MVDSPETGKRDVRSAPHREDPLALFAAQLKRALVQKDWLRAESVLGRLTEARPDDLASVRLHAQVLRELGRSAEAERLLIAAWKRSEPGAEHTRDARRDLVLELADLRLEDGRPADAARALRRVLELEPHQWEALFLLGNAFFDAGHVEEADRAYRASVATHPFEPEPWWNLAACAQARGDLVGRADALEGWLAVSRDAPEREDVLAELDRLRAPHAP